jgi:hypothetical protein
LAFVPKDSDAPDDSDELRRTLACPTTHENHQGERTTRTKHSDGIPDVDDSTGKCSDDEGSDD